jgi:hypothetical protein
MGSSILTVAVEVGRSRLSCREISKCSLKFAYRWDVFHGEVDILSLFAEQYIILRAYLCDMP